MIKLINGGVYYTEGRIVKEKDAFMVEKKKQAAIAGTLSYSVLKAHNRGGEQSLKLRFDRLASGDEACAEIISGAVAAGMKEFSLPFTFGGYGTDEFLLSAAKKYGGNFVPCDVAEIGAYICERQVKCGETVLYSCERAGFGALGAMAVRECGGELIKQHLNKTYDLQKPAVIAVYLRGKPKKGVGPCDVALALIAAASKKGFLKNKVLEFVGAGIKNLSMDYRIAIDEAVAETGCLATVWETDETCGEYFKMHGRQGDFKVMKPAEPSYYDGAAIIDLSRVDPMICFNFDPFNAVTVEKFIAGAGEINAKAEKLGLVKLQEGKPFICGGAIEGGYESIAEASEILKGGKLGAEFSLSVRPQSSPVFKALSDNGYTSALIGAGAAISSCVSERAAVFMDARSMAATAANGGKITPATDVEYVRKIKKYSFDGNIYENKVYCGEGKPDEKIELASVGFADKDGERPLPQNILMRLENFPLTNALELVEEASAAGVKLQHDVYCAGSIAAKSLVGELTAAERKRLGFIADIACEYATRRYVSDLVNHGILPLLCRKFEFSDGDLIYVESARELIRECAAIPAKHISGGKVKNIMLDLALTEEERKILLCGGLVSYLKN